MSDSYPYQKIMTIRLNFYEDDIDRMRQKFDILTNEDLCHAVWECIETYLEL